MSANLKDPEVRRSFCGGRSGKESPRDVIRLPKKTLPNEKLMQQIKDTNNIAVKMTNKNDILNLSFPQRM